MGKALSVVAFLTLVVTGLAVATPTAAQTNQASIRIIQTSPDTPVVDVFFNSNKLVSGLKYQTATKYAALPGGSYNLKVFSSPSDGNGTPAVNLPDFNFSDGSVNTLVVVGLQKDKSLSILPLSDTNRAPMPGKARVRFLHTSPDAPAIDISAAGLGKVFSKVSFKSVGNYLDVPAGTVNFTITPAGATDTIMTKTLTFEDGKVYTVYATGQLKDKTLDVLSVVDSSMPILPATGQGAANHNGGGLPLLWVLSLLLVASTLMLTALSLRRRQASSR